MSDFVFSYEPTIRIGCFLAIFGVIAFWEVLLPRRKLTIARSIRWPSNLGIVALNTVFVRMVVPAAVVGMAALIEQKGWGLLNLVTVPGWVAILLSLLIFDLIIYLQHVMFHAVPGLWRLHRMHHTDMDFDVTTGSRFHPVEILISMGIKISVVFALGPPALAVLIFEVLLNATSMFNHGNVRIAPSVDRWLRWIVVTPDMHRVHHSVVVRETNSNFGFNLPWWDHLLGTYRAQPAAGHETMTIGIDQFRTPRDLRLDRMLIQPFRGDVGNYSIKGQDLPP